MSLTILAAMVVFGIAAVVAVVHWTGGSRLNAFEDREAAVRVFLTDYPGARIEDVRLTQRRDAAFLKQAQSGRLGFAQVFGHHHLTRDLGPGDLVQAAMLDHAAVTIRARDLTWKGGRFVFDTTTDAEDVARWCPKPRTVNARHMLGEVRHG